MSEPIIHELNVDFRDLNIRPEDILPAMQYPEDSAPEHIPDLIRGLLRQVPEHASIRTGYTILKPDYIDIKRHQISIHNITFFTGKTVTRYMKDSHYLAAFLSTLGESFDTWLHATFHGGDPVGGFIIDAIGSEAVERVGDILEGDLSARINESSWALTNRFSPGYCNWDITEQQKLFSLLPENFCGVKLTDSSLMIPAKSISGIIGAGPAAGKVDYPCSLCAMTSCYRRRLPTREIST